MSESTSSGATLLLSNGLVSFFPPFLFSCLFSSERSEGKKNKEVLFRITIIIPLFVFFFFFPVYSGQHVTQAGKRSIEAPDKRCSERPHRREGAAGSPGADADSDRAALIITPPHRAATSEPFQMD